jgi:hypothetical protein
VTSIHTLRNWRRQSLILPNMSTGARPMHESNYGERARGSWAPPLSPQVCNAKHWRQLTLSLRRPMLAKAGLAIHGKGALREASSRESRE